MLEKMIADQNSDEIDRLNEDLCGVRRTLADLRLSSKEVFEENSRLREEALRYYRADGTYMVLQSPAEVVAARVKAAQEVAQLHERRGEMHAHMLMAQKNMEKYVESVKLSIAARDERISQLTKEVFEYDGLLDGAAILVRDLRDLNSGAISGTFKDDILGRAEAFLAPECHEKE